MLLPQDHLEGQGLPLGLASDLGSVLICDLEFLSWMGLQCLVCLAFLFNFFYVILNKLHQVSSVRKAFCWWHHQRSQSLVSCATSGMVDFLAMGLSLPSPPKGQQPLSQRQKCRTGKGSGWVGLLGALPLCWPPRTLQFCLGTASLKGLLGIRGWVLCVYGRSVWRVRTRCWSLEVPFVLKTPWTCEGLRCPGHAGQPSLTAGSLSSKAGFMYPGGGYPTAVSGEFLWSFWCPLDSFWVQIWGEFSNSVVSSKQNKPEAHFSC